MAVKTVVKNLYELLIVVKPSVGEDGLENTISTIESAIKNYGGNVVKIDEPLRRRFAHKIKGFKDGYYVSLLFNSPLELPNTLKRTLSINDEVLRYILVKQER